MTAKKGYYSLVQFCPDASRLEAVNIGVVLFCPDVRFIAARLARGNQRAAKLVGRAGLNQGSLISAKRALERRLEVDSAAFQSLEDLRHFVDTRANVLQLTVPRPVKVFEPATDLDRLFQELVGGCARHKHAEPPVPQLDDLFQRLSIQKRARLDWTVDVPIVGRRLHVPYAFKNGAWNLIKPYRFSEHESPAISAAMRLAIEGDLIQKDHDDEGQKKLIVLSSFETKAGMGLEQRIENLLSAYNVETVRGNYVAEFAARIEREAH